MSKELGVPYDVCADAYMSQWHFIHKKLNEFSLKEMTLEQFKQTKHNFNLTSIGKLYVTEDMFKKIFARYQIINQKKTQNVQNQEDTPDVQHGDNHDGRISGGD